MKKNNHFYAPALIIFCLSALFISCHSTKNTTDENYPTIYIQSDNDSTIKNTFFNSDSALKAKYAQMLQINPNEIHNIKLYRFIDEWLNTPYKWGGESKKGIDCSSFVQKLFNNVYDIDIPRTSIQQFFTKDVEPFASKEDLNEGDMVFFKTIKHTVISHVGFYLANNKFVNASSSYGVSIGDLQTSYWKKKYVAAGRIKRAFSKHKSSTQH